MPNILERHLQSIERISNRFDAYGYLLDYVREIGFRYFSLHRFTPGCENELRRTIVVSNLPESLLATLEDGKLIAHSPGYRKLRTSVLPFVWDFGTIERSKASDEGAAFRAALEVHGIVSGACTPTHDSAGHHGALALTGTRETLNYVELSKLSLMANRLFERINQCGDSGLPNREIRLSDRERECISWTSAGKTSGEIAKILGLSEHTVNQYVAAVCHKLGTVNRAQAVATAIRLHIID